MDGVNTFEIDQGLGIVITCKTGNRMEPDISKDVLGRDRYLFCDGEFNFIVMNLSNTGLNYAEGLQIMMSFI